MGLSLTGKLSRILQPQRKVVKLQAALLLVNGKKHKPEIIYVKNLLITLYFEYFLYIVILPFLSNDCSKDTQKMLTVSYLNLIINIG